MDMYAVEKFVSKCLFHVYRTCLKKRLTQIYALIKYVTNVKFIKQKKTISIYYYATEMN